MQKRKHPLAFPKPKLLRTTAWKRCEKRQRLKRLNSRLKRIKSDNVEISEEQKEIKEKQTELRGKFEAVDLERAQLQNETRLIIQQSARTQIRLALMFQILKARENLELDKAALLTNALREVIAREEQDMNGCKKGWRWSRAQLLLLIFFSCLSSDFQYYLYLHV
ncbi:putative Phosphatidylinositol glycan [Hibiscus syriacus]|uniref:Phosphatidylinositol glycan n=1 Tax=Hibiscus syriacus TaxID=106335 RepID=A0A6A2XXU6_HIBSY|nr:uncharacterized protein LOC120187944 [Hibiscus syriacus]KAE8661267.1 putative Phosphatidylinositol glycan [Hibiscus syriacus]